GEIWARQQAENENRTLKQRIAELEEERKAQGRTNVEVLSQHGSNSRQCAVGKDVILFTILRSELPAARGKVISINPNTMVGGQPLGNEYCELVVNVVMKRDAMLPRSYGDMKTMASALKMSIAWPYNKIKECMKKECKKASTTPLKGIAGCVGQSLT
uniref:Transposase Tnp1/En/Spm-like domain-containing protein n=1 Tax=Oryza brachyantha TaxID=4533 RepID=J3LWJ6_ORYBR